jgi:hypothetical protein
VISRRQLLSRGLAASAIGLAPRMTRANAASARTSPHVAYIVVDERFEAARTLAAALAPSQIPRLALPRDVLELWHRKLEPACRTRRQAIAGVTTERGFFLLRTLAADHRLRVHSRTAHGSLVSWLIGPK